LFISTFNRSATSLGIVYAVVGASAWCCFFAALLHAAEPPAEETGRGIAVQFVPALGGLEFELALQVAHANDQSGRLFVVGQRGVIHVVVDRDQPLPKIFLDIRQQVRHQRNQNEEGLLGLAFHPDHARNGQLFIYYTAADQPKRSVLSRFRVDRENRDRCDPESEEILLEIEQPFWNHNGGTLIFGPDGYLYIGLGDGGSANDPSENGQNPRTLLGSILRIDVDRREGGLPYAIPEDNPFVGRTQEGRPEVWAFGLRNVWRMAFDPATDELWCGDVGQDAWEEINVIHRGGNYGWNIREGLHELEKSQGTPNGPLIDPLWEYPRHVGKSITGGNVYRGQRLPELVGKYLFADYVAGSVWALDYDLKQGQVRQHYTLRESGLPVVSFSEDEQGEVFLIDSAGQIFQLAPGSEN